MSLHASLVGWPRIHVHRRRPRHGRDFRGGAGHLVFEPKGRGGENGRRDAFRSGRTSPEEGTEYSVQPEAWRRYPRSIQHPWQETGRSTRSAAWARANRGRGIGLQPSLFTRLAVAEAELRAVKEILADVLEILAEMKANQDEMRQDHDARRGRAERPLTDRRRPWWRRLGNHNSIFGRAREKQDDEKRQIEKRIRGECGDRPGRRDNDAADRRSEAAGDVVTDAIECDGRGQRLRRRLLAAFPAARWIGRLCRNCSSMCRPDGSTSSPVIVLLILILFAITISDRSRGVAPRSQKRSRAEAHTPRPGLGQSLAPNVCARIWLLTSPASQIEARAC